MVLGRNDHLAWSMTTTNSDTQDLFVEKLVPGDAVTPATVVDYDMAERSWAEHCTGW